VLDYNLKNTPNLGPWAKDPGFKKFGKILGLTIILKKGRNGRRAS
jgi:hypothetical protein